MKFLPLFVLCVLVLTSPESIGQVPQSINYQLVVRNTDGLVLSSQEVGVQFDILQGSSSGSSVYSETHSESTNAFGLINLKIGQGSSTDDFSAIDWSIGPYFISTSLDQSGGTSYQLYGTSELVTVPYSMLADHVVNDSVNDDDADPANEIQSLNYSSGTLNISGANSVSIPDSVNDADADPLNEIQGITEVLDIDSNAANRPLLNVERISVGVDTAHQSAAVHIESESKGFLLPRMTEAQRDAIIAPVEGLLVFQMNGAVGFYYFIDGTWIRLIDENASTNYNTLIYTTNGF